MRKVYYIYNPKTRTYDRIYPTMRQRAMSYLRRLFVGMGLGAGCFIILLLIFGSPSEKDLRVENSRLLSQYHILSTRLDEALDVMQQLQQRDDNLYRVIMQADPRSGCFAFCQLWQDESLRGPDGYGKCKVGCEYYSEDGLAFTPDIYAVEIV